MLKVEVKGGNVVITADGDLLDVVADFAVVIHQMFNILHKDNPGVAMAFKFGMQKAMVDPEIDVFSVDKVCGTGTSVIIPTKDGK